MDGYDDFDATGLADLVRRGETTAEALLDEALRRTAALEPRLGAVTRVAEDQARAAAREISGASGAFAGVPFLLKDLDAGAVGLPTDEACRLTLGTEHDHDAEVTARLRRAGLVMFGRTAAPEGGIGVTTEAAVYGRPTRNPWAPGRSAGGSSGGAAAAVAAGIVPAAHGSDGGGSVRIPASCCGLVGFKPSRGRLPEGPDSGEGWGGMATNGFLTQTLRDTAALLDTVAGPDLGAPYVAPAMKGSFSEALARDPAPLRIALCATTFEGAPVHPDCRRAAEETAALLEDMGHRVEEARPSADQRAMMRAWTDIVACGTWGWVRAEAAAKGLPGHGLDLLEPVARGACLHAMTLTGADYLAAVNAVHAFGRAMALALAPYDVLLSPTLAEPPAELGRFAHARPEFEDFLAYRMGPGGCFEYSPFTAAFNASGQPAVSLPLGWSGDLPVGVHLAAAFGDDARLMSLCGQIERARPWAHRRPRIGGLQTA